MESLAYEGQEDTAKRVERMLNSFLGSFKDADQGQVDARKSQILALRGSIKYLTQNRIVPDEFSPKLAIEALIKKYKLDEKK